MTDKKRPSKEPQPPAPKTDEDSLMAGRIRDSARQIWLAGLGAYTKAEEDAGRFFERLVHEGEEIETKTRGLVERQGGGASGRGCSRSRHRHLGSSGNHVR